MRASFKSLLRNNWGFITFICLIFVFRSSFADWYEVPTGSMQPTIVEGDRIFVNKMAYRLDIPFTDVALFSTGEVARGDIVVFESEAANNRLVKRVIGLPGDHVSMVNNRLNINGETLRYEALDTYQRTEFLETLRHPIQLLPGKAPLASFNDVVVPAGHYLVLGDNRNNSADSRVYGFVPATEVQGKALKVLVSLDPENYYLPRGDRLLLPMI